VIRAFVVVFQFLFWLFVVRLALRAAASLFRPGADTPKPKRSTELVRDRVCNTFVPQDRALVATVSGKAEYFCSAACRDQAHLAAP